MIYNRGFDQFRGAAYRHMGNFEPSVNYLIFTPDDIEIILGIERGRLQVENMFNVKRLYYLLYSSENGTVINDEETQKIFEAAVKIINPLSEWLSVSQYTGSIQTESAGVITLNYDSKNLLSGTYLITVQFETNDSSNKTLLVPITLTVKNPEPQNISVTPSQIDFNQVTLDTVSSFPLKITNTGEDFLRISNVIIAGDNFSMEDIGDILLDNGESIDLPINFTPDVQGDFTGTITINSNDSNSPAVIIGMSGESREPFASQTLSELNFALEKDQSLVNSIDLINTGEGALQWFLSDPEYFEENIPLEEVMETFKQNFEAVTRLIPNR